MAANTIYHKINNWLEKTHLGNSCIPVIIDNSDGMNLYLVAEDSIEVFKEAGMMEGEEIKKLNLEDIFTLKFEYGLKFAEGNSNQVQSSQLSDFNSVGIIYNPKPILRKEYYTKGDPEETFQIYRNILQRGDRVSDGFITYSEGSLENKI